ncbi:KpsF/GutQ family sugar-phosphate isomerase [Alishewanella sp. 16-MA]|uniref:Arabinose 5-phosphate isomerase n=1 Tax=Alishewanella maricola TaxID=2795740 RepID=A0ABS8BYY2_9ALTE|nr:MULTISPECIES: KpsF/GutQ family sugar-phosphate isomerase [Gammaproteobacteria]MDP4944369.1 KpsF/GutQ family sugar-phosphate isomerase [Alishewanella sp.]MCB5225263.1 KpsF/GutQ family sugar-phosphate isomerase [Alishewanella maricola]MCC5450839.1 KpsF/GutQ family sugar-phosphate isomerase [Rheinheimera sp. UJ51]MDP5036314.1 KpsF/GutQ family sugar-phosphate isomerase [Alishewanella sp.]MDP5188246.1 KpsF/GutQ family sugar-phosphate isomerase [Alishewanella sp.]
MTTKTFREQALAVLRIEAEAVRQLEQYLNDDFERACQLVLDNKGKVIVSGIGKSGHIANKIAATLASTGSPAFFVHPGEASHGDLGMLSKDDIVIAISNSGETAELLTIVPIIKRMGIPLIAMTGKADSTLARLADIHLCVAVPQEACPLGLAPTASTTATLAMGDALAVAVLDIRGFSADDFALSHPGGSLGRKLLLRLEDLMHKENLVPIVPQEASIKDALLEISRKGLGMTTVVDAQGRLAGLFTDGDLRRILDQRIDIHSTSIAKVMTVNCITVKAEMLAAEALNIMQQRKINGLIIVNEQREPIGAMNMHDLLRAGVM